MDPYFQTRMEFNPARENIWKAIARYVQRYIPQHAKVLELGAAYCNFINNIDAKEKHALDISSQVKESAAQDVEAHVMSATQLSALKGSFDVIFASNFFEHLEREDFHTVIKLCFQKLNTGGRLILLQPNYRYAYKEYFDDYTHTMILSDISLCDALKSVGFSILRCTPRFLPFSMKGKAPKFGWMVWLYLRSPVKPFAKQMFIVAEKK